VGVYRMCLLLERAWASCTKAADGAGPDRILLHGPSPTHVCHALATLQQQSSDGPTLIYVHTEGAAAMGAPADQIAVAGHARVC